MIKNGSPPLAECWGKQVLVVVSPGILQWNSPSIKMGNILHPQVRKAYSAKIIFCSKKKRIYNICNSTLIDGLLSTKEKQKYELLAKKTIEIYGHLPVDEEITVGKRLEIALHLDRKKHFSRFEISPLCDKLFEQLIVLIGYDEIDRLNNTSQYKRYTTAKKCLESYPKETR
ncbi:hypothetical protein LQZ18_10035 [Lachnospiraceae bacterium ZAX-1]